MRAWIETWLTKRWYESTLALALLPLVPLSWLFRVIILIRRFAYQHKLLSSYRPTLPVIVVGNITVGGTGKTSFVIWLANTLRAHGFQPGIILRGAGSKDANHLPIWVEKETPITLIGDEARLLATHTSAPVVVSPNRVAAAKLLEASEQCNIIISDDGLQHYRLQRDIEILLIDKKRQFGNQQLLPAGPLREPISRQKTVDFIVEHGANQSGRHFATYYKPTQFIAVTHHETTRALSQFTNKTVHAVAGIGHPEQFFSMLEALGLTVIPHAFPDHHAYQAPDLIFKDDLPIVMTEKDAVKCKEIANENTWYLAVQLVCEEHLITLLIQQLKYMNVKVNYQKGEKTS